MLVVIDIVKHNPILWFDPIGNSPPKELKTFLNTCFGVYYFRGGTRKSSKQPQWLKVDCPRQPGTVECAYYVMRYMLEIVTSSNSMMDITEIFQDTTAYSQEEVDEVRDLWTTYFLQVF